MLLSGTAGSCAAAFPAAVVSLNWWVACHPLGFWLLFAQRRTMRDLGNTVSESCSTTCNQAEKEKKKPLETLLWGFLDHQLSLKWTAVGELQPSKAVYWLSNSASIPLSRCGRLLLLGQRQPSLFAALGTIPLTCWPPMQPGAVPRTGMH